LATISDRAMPQATVSARPGLPDRLPYMGGLDGLRAIAVIAVLLYHADFSWARGGYLGVEVFFVISGFLITSLLLLEHEREGRVDLRGFWARRARRLLPALFTLLLVVGVVATVFVRDSVYRLGRDSLAATGYATNWYLIGTQDSYFEAFGRPPLLRHLWSLSVEEQFYLLWPLIFVAALALLGWRINRNRAHARMVVLLVCGIGVSTALMWLWFVPFEDPSRIYYGTDTRAGGLLVGALLAFLWRPWRFRGAMTRGAKVAMNIVGFSALGLLIALNMNVSEFGPFLYRGGFLVVGLTTAAVIAVVVHPEAAVGSALSARILRWIGTRSYGIYLWHWPVFAVTRPGVDVDLAPAGAFALRVAATLALAELSYRLVESPIRRLGLGGWLRSIGVRLQPVPAASWVGATAAMVAVALVAVGLALGADSPPGGGEVLASSQSDVADMVATPRLPEPSAAEPEEPMVLAEAGESTTTTAPDPGAPPAGDQPIAAELTHRGITLLVGDSVMLGAADSLRRVLGPDIVVDAVVNRQMRQSPEVVEAARGADPDIDTVVIHLGTNGAFNSETFDHVMESLRDVDRVVFINTEVPRRWEEIVNSALADGVERWDNAELLDWSTVAAERPELFRKDHVHLNAEGQQVYAELVAEAIGRPVADEDTAPDRS
jgi:peptidoglycan/LPS O-acetylase OafA/YrhL